MNLRAILCALALALACGKPEGPGGPKATGSGAGASGSANLAKLMKDRNLSEADVTAALKTYMPSGRKDEYLIFASGGHSGQVLVIGVPSMRMLKYVAVFTPEPWQGYGFGDEGSEEVLRQGSRHGQGASPGATCTTPRSPRPRATTTASSSSSTTRPTPRIAVIDLKDFETKQIVRAKLIEADHGGAFVTPEHRVRDRDVAVPRAARRRLRAAQGVQREVPRAAMTFWKFDRAKGRIDPRGVVRDRAAAVHAGPRRRRQARPRDGWAFCNSIQHRDGHRRDARGQPAARVRRLAERHGLPAHHQLEEGRRGGRRPARPR